jgi:hypothetical protein
VSREHPDPTAFHVEHSAQCVSRGTPGPTRFTWNTRPNRHALHVAQRPCVSRHAFHRAFVEAPCSRAPRMCASRGARAGQRGLHLEPHQVRDRFRTCARGPRVSRHICSGRAVRRTYGAGRSPSDDLAGRSLTKAALAGENRERRPHLDCWSLDRARGLASRGAPAEGSGPGARVPQRAAGCPLRTDDHARGLLERDRALPEGEAAAAFAPADRSDDNCIEEAADVAQR